MSLFAGLHNDKEFALALAKEESVIVMPGKRI
jgi:hypothetical protein